MEQQIIAPLIVQSDGSILLDLHSPSAEEARGKLSAFAELVSSPEHLHTYKVSNLSLWNAASAGISALDILSGLKDHSRYPIPDSLMFRIKEALARWGALQFLPGNDDHTYILQAKDKELAEELAGRRELRQYLTPIDDLRFSVQILDRGSVKQAVMKAGWPIVDKIPLKDGEPLPMELSKGSPEKPFGLRDYQEQARDCFLGGGLPGNGYGVLVLPCGAGKTIIGMSVMTKLSFETLILCPNVSAIRQWKREILSKTNLTEDQVGEYSGEVKEIKPVTIASFQILCYRNAEGEFPHFPVFTSRNWGLVIYDEVHLLPAPVFRMTAEIQSRHRLGLTATLVREDGLESDVFSLVGPKRFDIPWKVMETAGWIARAVCIEYRIPLLQQERRAYVSGTPREQSRIAACSRAKMGCVSDLVHKHAGEHILVIGQYLDQIKEIAKYLGAPIITGSMANAKRDELYQKFRDGIIKVLVVSKVANFAIDLPDASVAIQVSGTFGSRQEEAQRLGRIMRPKERQVYFYTLVSRLTIEEEYSTNRQRFLGEQGYAYQLSSWEASETEV